MAEDNKVHPVDAARLVFADHKRMQDKMATLENFNLIRTTQYWVRGRSQRKA